MRVAEKTLLWDRQLRGESLKAIGRPFSKPSSSIYCRLSAVLRRPVETIARKLPRQSLTGASAKGKSGHRDGLSETT